MKVYLAGKITGDPNHREKFAAAVKKLEERAGVTVISPAVTPEGLKKADYPGISDPKDRWFSVRRFLTWAANTFILTYFQKVDSPANKRLIEAIVDSENVRGNGFVARGVCARYEITFNEDENTTADLLDGKITFHQYITPFTPAEDIEDIIEFDPDALSAALN